MIVGAPQRRALYTALATLWLSGVGFWLLDLSEGGPQSWRPRLLAAHGLAAFAFAGLVGSLWPHHVVRAWRAAANRRSGGSLVAWSVILALSGWALYYSGGEALRAALRGTHIWLGLSGPVLVLLHVRLGRRWRRRLLDERERHGRLSADQP